MKKIICLIMALTFVFVTAIFSGCELNFIDTTLGGEVNVNSGESGNKKQEESNGGTGGETLPYSYNIRKVRINESTTEYTEQNKMTVVDAIKSVERSAVSLSVTNGTSSGAGSGVIVDINTLTEQEEVADKSDLIYIITCYHMIENGGDITVYLPDDNCWYNNKDLAFSGSLNGTAESNANNAVQVIGGDFTSDIALLSLDLSKKSTSGKTLSNEDKQDFIDAKVKLPNGNYQMQKGEEVFSIGNPTGELPGTVSVGAISYLERETSVDDIGSMLLLQIDVTSNPGNSGGGLYNLYGELIGITNAGNTNYTNMNFAIPYKLTNDKAETKISETASNYGFEYCITNLLATASSTNYGCIPGVKKKFGFTAVQESSNGSTYVYVYSVTANSLSAKAGLKENDVILKTKVGETETEIKKLEDFTAVLQNLQIGSSVVISGTRIQTTTGRWGQIISSKEVEFSVTLTAEQFAFNN